MVRVVTAAGIGSLVGVLAMSSCSASTSQSPANHAKKKLTIGFAMPVLANPFWRSEADFATHVADQLGNTVVIVTDAQSDEGKQLQQVEDLISRGVDGLIVSPVTAAVGPAELKAAKNANIPIVFAERDPGFQADSYPGNGAVGFLGLSNVQGGEQTAAQLYKAGARKIVAMAGLKGSSVADGRVAGLQKFAQEHSDFKVLQVEYGAELQADGLKVTEAYLAAYPGPGFDGIWCYNDEEALGAATALTEAKVPPGKVKITGFDGTKEGAAAIASGVMLADSGGQFVSGGLGLVMLYDKINGHQPQKSYVQMVYLLIDASNVARYQIQFLDNTPAFDVRSLSLVYNPSATTADYKIVLK